MTSERSAKTKKSTPPQRPYPWRCRECGKKSVSLGKTKYDAEVRHDGRLHTFIIPALEIPICQSCGAKVFTGTVDEQVNSALRKYLILLSPQEIRSSLQRIGASQKELAIRLGIAEATLSRWVNGSQIQSRSMDTLLRLYCGIPLVRNTLLDRAQDPTFGLSDISGESNAQDHHRNVKKPERRFTAENGNIPIRNAERDRCKAAQDMVQTKGTTWASSGKAA